MLAATLVLAAAAEVWPAFPGGLQESLGFSADEILRADREAVVREVDTEGGGRRLSLAGIVRIAAPPNRVAEELRRMPGVITSPALKQRGSLSTPATLADVAGFQLPSDDLTILKDCQVGACKFKLRKEGIERFRQLDWSAPDAAERATMVAREAMVDYTQSYQQRGRDALAVYVDKTQPMSLADGLGPLLAQAEYVRRYLPMLDRHLREYPNSKLAGAEDQFFWTVKDFGRGQVTAVIHAVFLEPPDRRPALMIAYKHLFASHYFQARLALTGLFADAKEGEPAGTVLVYVDRMLFDGQPNRLVRRMIVRRALEDVRGRLISLRAHLGG